MNVQRLTEGVFTHSLVVLVLLCVTVHPSPTRAQAVNPSQLTAVEVLDGSVRKSFYCLENQPGSLRDNGIDYIFLPLSKDVTKLTKQAKKNKKLATKLKKLKKLYAAAVLACGGGSVIPNPSATATPSPGSSPTPTKSATPTPSATPDSWAIFDANGNVTNAGKTYLGIPSTLSANIDRGDSVHKFNTCSGCHAEKTLWHYNELSTRLPQSPMFFEIPNKLTYQDLADLVAYLNRFQLKVPGH